MGRHFSGGRGGGGRRGGRGGGGRGGRGGRGRGGGGPRQSAMANFRGPGYDDAVARSVDEPVVGISRFLTPDVPGFHGTIKERFSDFIVREVALSGEITRLTEVARPVSARDAKKELKISEIVKKRVLGFLEDASKLPAGPDANGDVDTADGAVPINNRIRGLVGKLAGRLLGLHNHHRRLAALATDRRNVLQLRAVISEVCDEATAEGLARFLDGLLDARLQETSTAGAAGGSSDEFLLPVLADKDARMRIHQGIRDLAGTFAISDTVSNATGDSIIRVRRMLVGGKKRKDMDQRGTANRPQWPSDRPDFLQFVLYKKNMETLSVISQLARAMGVNQSSFTYAGTKDKRGITTQLVTVYRGNVDKLRAVNRAKRELEEFNFIVGNPTYVSDRLNLGDLKGNRFAMAIRSLPEESVISDQDIHRAVESWAARGFINYFGLQRFGTRSIATHEIGRAILRRDYKVAIDLIMRPQDGDASKITEARQHFVDHQDIDAAMRSLPPYFIAEHSILKGFKAHGLTAHTQAIACIPRHLRMMYTHSYQSYVWNTIASERIERFPTDTPIVGDLVLVAPEDVPDDPINGDEFDGTTMTDHDLEETSAPAKKRKLPGKSKPEVIVLTEANVSQFSIYDVVLPLPGYDIVYPENELKGRYEMLLAQDGVDFSSLSRATNSEYHLPGSYRHLVRKPIDVKHEIKRYDDPTIPLLETDVDRLVHKLPQASIAHAKQRALCLEFQLGPSSYATMAVRELMKQSSNLTVQLHLKKQLQTVAEGSA